MVEISQHDIEIQENRRHWERKPMLQRVYRAFYEEIARWTLPGKEGTTLELGSGMGNIKEVLPACLTSDLFPNPWLDRVENAYALNWPDKAVQNLILFDVLHHLQHPGRALAEMARVVRPSGRLIIFEPGMGLLPRLIMRLFHHEPLGFGQPIEWNAPAGFDPASHSYYAAQGNGWRIFVRREGLSENVLPAWRVLHVGREPGWAWLLCGGLRGPQLFPDALFPLVCFVERGLRLLPSLFAGRLLVVLERKDSPSND
jgi:SAM-dependent methyltransferase